MKNNNGLLIGIGAVALLSLALSVIVFFKTPKYAYVHNVKMFNEFTYKKELEKKLKRIEQAKKTTLDSLQVTLDVKANMLAGKKSNEAVQEFRIYEQQFLLKQKQYTEEYDNVAKQYTEQIWKQLNQYVKEYGEKNSYKMIFGTTTNGEIMYATEAEDLTDEVVQFANERYQGSAK